MCRILIADGSDILSVALAKQLKKFADVRLCHNGEHLLEAITGFQPDILFVDLMLPNCNTIATLHTARTSGCTAQFVGISTVRNQPLLNALMGLDFVYIFQRPCTVGNVVAFLRRLALDLPELSRWCVETEIDNVLLYLGFQCGRSRYDCVYQGILLKYCGKAGDSVKYLYSEVRRLCNKKSVEVVEKAIRDAIRNAWTYGDRNLWRAYFPTCDKTGCPSNEVFISRIALALINRERMISLRSETFDKSMFA